MWRGGDEELSGMPHRRNCRLVTSAHAPFCFNYWLKTSEQHTCVHADLSWGRQGVGEGGLSSCLFGHGPKPDGEVWLMAALGDIAEARWMMRSVVLLGRELMLHWCPNAVSLPQQRLLRRVGRGNGARPAHGCWHVGKEPKTVMEWEQEGALRSAEILLSRPCFCFRSQQEPFSSSFNSVMLLLIHFSSSYFFSQSEHRRLWIVFSSCTLIWTFTVAGIWTAHISRSYHLAHPSCQPSRWSVFSLRPWSVSFHHR